MTDRKRYPKEEDEEEPTPVDLEESDEEPPADDLEHHDWEDDDD